MSYVAIAVINKPTILRFIIEHELVSPCTQYQRKAKKEREAAEPTTTTKKKHNKTISLRKYSHAFGQNAHNAASNFG